MLLRYEPILEEVLHRDTSRGAVVIGPDMKLLESAGAPEGMDARDVQRLAGWSFNVALADIIFEDA